MMVDMVEALGAKAVKIAYSSVYSALQRQTIDDECHPQHHPKSAELDCRHCGSDQGSLCRSGSTAKKHFPRSGHSAA